MRLLGLLFGLGLAGAALAAPGTATLVEFEEEEAGGGGGSTRMLVTEEFLRIDEGDGADGFVLFDRARHTIYSVSHGEKTVLVVTRGTVSLKPPTPFRHGAERVPGQLPKLGGREVAHYRLSTNGERCFDVYAVASLLPQVVAVLAEYHQTLAAEQAAMQARMPAKLQSVCDLADLVFQPARYLAHGFPVRELRHNGSTRMLVNYLEHQPVTPGRFELPAGYRHYTTAQMRGAP